MTTEPIDFKSDFKRPLPDGWRWVRLGEVCRVVGGSTPRTDNPSYWDGGIVWITPTDLGKFDGIHITTSIRKITRTGYESCGTELLPTGSVVLSSRAPIGHLGIADVPLCTNQGCKSFIPGEKIESNFLFWVLKKFVTQLQALGSGATFTEISKSNLQSFLIPLPPLSEQKRIAAILNEQMETVRKARKATQAQLEAAKSLSASYLRQVFPRLDEELPEGWRWVRLGEEGHFNSGGTPSKENPKFWNGAIPFVTGADITELYISAQHARAFLTEDGLLSGKTAVCVPGTVLLVTRTRVGRVGIAIEEMGASQDLSPFVCGPNINPDFVVRYILSISDYLIENCRGATIQGLTRDFIHSIEIPLPPLSEQKGIAAILNEQMEKVGKVRRALEAQLEHINTLPASLLRRAFEGGL
ncbi:MAG: restriction endonuclease subunit S [Proteobacteria bacterium]|nr:restriction endonuclease subunit S [Pseudomonadota bacterium]